MHATILWAELFQEFRKIWTWIFFLVNNMNKKTTLNLVNQSVKRSGCSQTYALPANITEEQRHRICQRRVIYRPETWPVDGYPIRIPSLPASCMCEVMSLHDTLKKAEVAIKVFML